MPTTMTAATRDGSDRLSFETAAQHATRDVPLADPGQRIGDVREMLVSRRYESASHIVVCDARRFRGVMTIEDALAAPVDATVESVMDPHAPIVAPVTDQEVAAWQAVRHQESALLSWTAMGGSSASSHRIASSRCCCRSTKRICHGWVAS
jgi:magnesium transporter